MSVHDLITRLPDIDVVRDRCRAMAALDAVLSPEWTFRYFSFDAAWAPGRQAASMRNGAGDEYAVVFTRDGAWAYGFDHESEMSPYRSDPLTLWPGLVDTLPEEFTDLAAEPAFCDPLGALRATVCFWRARGSGRWACGSPAQTVRAGDDGGAGWLFEVLLQGAEGYCAFARDYYDVELESQDVRRVYALEPLTGQLLANLNPEAASADVVRELRGIGFEVEVPH